MGREKDRQNEIFQKMEKLFDNQVLLANELKKVKEELKALQKPGLKSTQSTAEKPADSKVPEKKVEPSISTIESHDPVLQREDDTMSQNTSAPSEVKRVELDIHKEAKREPRANKEPRIRKDIERFIGENLINKIGIVILVLGVSIGAKYAIDHDMISPLTRIILGYLVGAGLIGFAIKLKAKYSNFSAVLLGGALAILYFITFIAYSLYGLFPQIAAFGLMVLFTVFAVLASLNYNNKFIALLGLVGAYAVPFLLSDDSGKIVVFFSYIALVNVGILTIAIKKNWKLISYSAFGLTWLIFCAWAFNDYEPDSQVSIGLIFSSLYFFIFYITLLAYKVKNKGTLHIEDVVLILANAFIFYGLGYLLLNENEMGQNFLGLFTLLNAIVHFIVALGIKRRLESAPNLFYLVLVLVLTFITVAIPVQLDGNWVTFIWLAEAVLLFWIGSSKSIQLYTRLSYVMMLLAFFSLINDWTSGYPVFTIYMENQFNRPIVNIEFLTSLLFSLAFFIIYRIQRSKKSLSPVDSIWLRIDQAMNWVVPSLLVLGLYQGFRLEVQNFWDQRYFASLIEVIPEGYDYPISLRNNDLKSFGIIWMINYSLVFFVGLSIVHLKSVKNDIAGAIVAGILSILILAFLGVGLYELSELRETYIAQSESEYFNRGIYHLTIRYISLGFIALALATLFYANRSYKWYNRVRKLVNIFLHISVLWILSSELLHWLDLSGASNSYKLGLSILFGSYALFLIIVGIKKGKKHLRIAAIVLFSLTLVKLFLYDIAHLDAISKTIVLVSLGVLLLVISFLYNKYTKLIDDEGENT